MSRTTISPSGHVNFSPVNTLVSMAASQMYSCNTTNVTRLIWEMKICVRILPLGSLEPSKAHQRTRTGQQIHPLGRVCLTLRGTHIQSQALCTPIHDCIGPLSRPVYKQQEFEIMDWREWMVMQPSPSCSCHIQLNIIVKLLTSPSLHFFEQPSCPSVALVEQ